MVTPAAQKAIDRGLAFLAERQNDDGSFGSGGYSRNVAVCGLAGMAFMSAGSTPGRGPYGEHVDRVRRLHPGQHAGERLHRRAGLQQPRADVRPRLRHAVPGRGLRHDDARPTSARSWPRPSS